MSWTSHCISSLHDSSNSDKIDYLTYPEREDKMSDVKVPQLTEMERLQLHDLMMSMAFENERIDKYKAMIDMGHENLKTLSGKLNAWKNKFNKKLKASGLDMSMVNIDSDTGRISIDNIAQLPEKLNGTGKQHSSA